MCFSKTNNQSFRPSSESGHLPRYRSSTSSHDHASHHAPLSRALLNKHTDYLFPFDRENRNFQLIQCICMNHDQFVFHWSVSLILFSCFLVVNIQGLVLTRLTKYVSYLIVHNKLLLSPLFLLFLLSSFVPFAPFLYYCDGW
jgi:hypothetical protein